MHTVHKDASATVAVQCLLNKGRGSRQVTEQVLIGIIPDVDAEVLVHVFAGGRRRRSGGGKVPGTKACGNYVRYVVPIEEASILGSTIIADVELTLDDGVAFGGHGPAVAGMVASFDCGESTLRRGGDPRIYDRK